MSNLLQDLEAYITRTDSSPSQLGRKAVGDPGAIAGMRTGRTVKAATEAKWRAFMAANPEGVKRKNKYTQGATGKIGVNERMQTPHPEGMEPNREPCTRCGVRGDLGCKHRSRLKPPPLLMPYVQPKPHKLKRD